jgi:hypothetical protein
MAKCKLFSFRDDLIEVVPNALYMKSVVGETMSVGVVKFIAPEAKKLPSKEHAHGEEASLQIEGGCVVYQGVVGALPQHQVVLDAGTVMIVPADHLHYGENRYSTSGISLRLNVATPPRADYGSKDAAKVVYHPLENK